MPANRLTEVENLVMNFIWARGRSSAEAVREGLAADWPMKDSTVRTVLRRLEDKGYLTHSVEGRTYYYQGVEAPVRVAVRAVKHIIDRFCKGSVESLLMGMVDNQVLAPGQLQKLARKVAQSKTGRRRS